MTTTANRHEEGSRRRACVLHAEDDRLTSLAIARLLTLKGFTVESATDGLEALTELLSRPNSYDLIITDQSMPLLTGLEWLQEVREVGFSGRIIVFASSLPDEVASRFCELGVDRILSKAGSLQLLLDASQELLSKAPLRKG